MYEMLKPNHFNVVSYFTDNNHTIIDCCIARSVSELVCSTSMVVIFVYYTHYISANGFVGLVWS